jgi:hypothetical protein
MAGNERRERIVLAPHIAALQAQSTVHRLQENVACRAHRVFPQPPLEPAIELEREPERTHRAKLP